MEHTTWLLFGFFAGVGVFGLVSTVVTAVLNRHIAGNSSRTEGVSAAFIKEFMRRATQFAIERGSEDRIEQADVDNAIDEMLFKGGSFNLSILGGKTATCEAC